MQDSWKRILPGALRDVIALDHVEVSREKEEMMITLNAARFLSSREFRELSKAFADAFPKVRTNVEVRYPDLKETVLSDIRSASSLLGEIVGQESPGAASILNWRSEWKLSGEKLTLTVDSGEGAAYLKARGTEGLLERTLERLFGIRVRAEIAVCGDVERKLKEIDDLRQQELEQLAAQARLTGEKERPAAKSEAVIGKPIHEDAIPMDQLTEDVGRVILCGEVSGFEAKETKNGKTQIVRFSMTDRRGSASCKLFVSGNRGREDPKSTEAQMEALTAALKDGNWVKVRGSFRYDDFDRENILMVSDLMTAPKPVREDTWPRKRVELHCHTTFSTMDACTDTAELFARAKEWGHPALAITDHGVVQAFPAAYNAAKKTGVKLIPGCEAYLIEDRPSIVQDADDRLLEETAFVVLDVETTGLNPSRDRIIEIGAVRLEQGREVAEFSRMIDPGMPLPEKITELTGITDGMLKGQPRVGDVIGEFAQFCEGAVLVAHNAPFDLAFIRRAFGEAGLEMAHPVLDTLLLARNLYPSSRNHKLGTLCKMLDISLANAHRAVHDARATSLVLTRSIKKLQEQRTLITLSDLNRAFGTDVSGEAYHIVLLAKDQTGITNLNRIVSEGHLHYFYRTPRVPRSVIERYREGLILGSACESGELYRAMVAGADDARLEEIARFYDYLEIQPAGNNAFLVREGRVASMDEIRALNRRIVALGDRLGIPVVATGDVHFMEPQDGIFRAILMDTKGFEDADRQPPLYFKTTDEMMEEFSAYLGQETAERVVVDAPNAIAEQILPTQWHIRHPEGKETFQPFWEDAKDELTKRVMDRAHSIYGEPLPEVVQKRIDKELGAIVGYGFSTLYMIAVKLVEKSLSDGYIVGSRGSVGSSLVAYLAGITEVNSLPAHYVCPECKHVEFDIPDQYTCGLDLPPKECPVCGHPMDKDGFNIPFEVFLGFKGDKVPDIDLNFSGEYQPTAQNYVKVLFGKENVFRAGTIGTVADKTAFGYVLKYAEARGLNISRAEKLRLARGITGVKRTTGQHPAGMVVLPKDYEIYQFTAIQHPADAQDSETVTTHFDFTSMHDILVKLDILGHDDPTMLRKLQDLTGIAPQAVPLHDANVFAEILSLFTSPKALGLTAEELGCPTGTYGIPEFGTPFVRGMLVETRPSTMEELVRISGLSHGTGVWLGNTQDLVRRGVPLKECFCTRDDIMNQLISHGLKEEIAFKTMESVRKGRGLKPEMEEAIRAADTPDWYIDSCLKIGYMFPKSHAVAYVTMALRIAYFKIRYPQAYYTCYLMRNADAFNALTMITDDVSVLRGMIASINALEKEERERKDDEVTLLEILCEMNLRGIRLSPIDLYRSHAKDFLPDGPDRILPPISSLPGVGESAAEALCQAREAGEFISEEDMVRRKVARSTIDMLRAAGCLNALPETSQVTLFDL